LQTTLLSIAIALILTLVAALVGPLLIDWGNYRPLIEAEASRIVGAGVHVTGAIDGRLLPSPRLTLHDVTVGQGAEALRAGELTIQFALTPLMRGDWQAEEMRLSQPQMTLGVDAAGHVLAPKLAFGFEPEALTVERLQVEGGKVVLEDAANATALTLDNIFFNGRARSLIGPFNGSGSLTAAGEHYSIDLAAGRYGDGSVKLHLGLQPTDHPFSIDTDGTLSFEDGKPKFEGNLSLGPPPGLAREAKPWHVRGKVTAGARAALLQNLQFVYGEESEALKLSGSVRLDIGKTPSLSAELTTARLDLDRMLAGADGARPTPAEALRKFAQWSGGAAFVSAIPIEIGLSVNEVVLGGASLQNFGGDFNSVDGGWNLQKLEFRAPGFSQVALTGKLKVGDDGVSFNGPAVIDATEPKSLFAWWQGANAPGGSDLKPIKLRGDVTFGTDRIAIEALQARFDGKRVTGGLTYTYAAGKTPSKLDATINADDIDLDTAIALGKAMAVGSNVDGPQEIALKADLKRATFSGFSARDARAALTYGGDGLKIESLSVADLGGARFAAQGRIRFDKAGQQGSLTADLAAPDMKPVLAVLSRIAPQAADALTPAATAMSPAQLHATFTVADGVPPSEGKVTLSGTVGKARIAFDGAGTIDLQARTLGAVRVDLRLDARDGRQIASMLRLDRAFAVGDGPGTFSLAASGAAQGAMQVEARVRAPGLDAAAKGSVNLADKREADLQVTIAHADASPLRGDGGAALPVTYASRAVLSGNDLTLSNIRAGIGVSKVTGRLSLTPGDVTRIGGEIEADTAEAPATIAAAIGLPEAKATAARGVWRWSSDPFAPGLFGALQGEVAFRAHRLDLSPRLAAREVHTTLRFASHRIAAENVGGTLAGGALKGSIAFADGSDGVSAAVTVSLAKADATALIAAGARPPLSGTIGLELSVDGSGLSPAALIGSLAGTGKISLDRAQFAGLDPRAFDAVTRAVDQGVPIEGGRIADVVTKALESGQLSVKHAEGAIVVGAGQLRLRTAQALGEDADATLSGALDLTNGALDGRLVLSGASRAAGARPDIYMALKGSVAEPTRSIDVSALTGWLTLRSVDNEARKLKAAEEAAAKARAAEEAAARKRAEEDAAAKAKLAAEAAAKAAASANPVFPPMSPPLFLTPTSPVAPQSPMAPALPPPVSVDALPRPPAMR
jgi:large subunit ribosomal protein L24